MLKRIWAIVNENDFYACRQRAESEGMTLGQALAALTHIYATGEEVSADKVKEHSEHYDYIKAHNDVILHLSDVEL